ncbi:MAG: tyrosine-type recombinase/integrase [Nitrospirae bacterium]|nr:tyrosine-type recombinase/integrase [Nitrospirota bacterium]
MLALIRAILRMAYKAEWIEAVPPVDMMAEPKKRIRWLTEEEADRLLSELPVHQERIARFALLTGLRQGNILNLAWSQVDLARKVLWVHPDQAKGRKAIGVPLAEAAVLLLEGLHGMDPRWVFTYEGKKEGWPGQHIGLEKGPQACRNRELPLA